MYFKEPEGIEAPKLNSTQETGNSRLLQGEDKSLGELAPRSLPRLSPAQLLPSHYRFPSALGDFRTADVGLLLLSLKQNMTDISRDCLSPD